MIGRAGERRTTNTTSMTSMLRCALATCRPSASSRLPAIRMRTPDTPIRWMSRPLWSASSTFCSSTPQWSSTAVVINYDDSDGWYDHQMGPIVNQSTTASDMLSGNGQCGTGTTMALGRTGHTACAGTLWLWTAASDSGDFAVCATETSWITP